MEKKKKMPEKEYRASRICRIIGNPTAYRILKLLSPDKKKIPSEIAKDLGLTITTVSKTLRNLRNVDLVRYDTKKNVKKYFLKDKSILKILSSLEIFVEKIKHKRF